MRDKDHALHALALEVLHAFVKHHLCVDVPRVTLDLADTEEVGVVLRVVHLEIRFPLVDQDDLVTPPQLSDANIGSAASKDCVAHTRHGRILSVLPEGKHDNPNLPFNHSSPIVEGLKYHTIFDSKLHRMWYYIFTET